MVSAAIEALGEGQIAPEALADPQCELWQNLQLLHSQAASQGYSYQVSQVTVTAQGDRNFRYEAQVNASNQETPLKLVGSVQFNEEGLIDFFSVEQGN